MGRGFRHNYDITLQDNGEKVDIVLEDGCHLYFVKEKNLYVGKNTVDELLMYEDGVFRLQTEGGIVLTFDKDNRISRREDKNGVGLTFYTGKMAA